MGIKAFNVTIQGASHIKKNKECQDASKSFFCENFAVAVVCDGHGGDDYIRSAIGSEKASKIAMDHIKKFVTNVDREKLTRQTECILRALEASIIAAWNQEISEHWLNNPITEIEKEQLSEKAKRRYLAEDNKFQSAYGTTLIAAVLANDYWFCFQIGDGKCVWITNDSKFEQLELDERCFLNATTSLCDSDALAHFHYCFGETLPAAVFVGSDGVDDCFKDDEQLYSFYKAISYSFANEGTEKKAQQELEEFLPRLSQKGSGDDISVAAVLNMDVLQKTTLVNDYNRDNESARKNLAEQEENRQFEELKKRTNKTGSDVELTKEE